MTDGNTDAEAMTDVDKFTPQGDEGYAGYMQPDHSGDWVRASDYDALAAKLAEVTAERDRWSIRANSYIIRALAEAETKEYQAGWLEAEGKLSDAEAELAKVKADAWFLDFQLTGMATRAEAAEAERVEDAALLEECEAVIIAQRTRINQLEAMLPRAYRAGVEAGAYLPNPTKENSSWTVCPEVLGNIRKDAGEWAVEAYLETIEAVVLATVRRIRALPTPTSAELLAQLKETE